MASSYSPPPGFVDVNESSIDPSLVPFVATATGLDSVQLADAINENRNELNADITTLNEPGDLVLKFENALL